MVPAAVVAAIAAAVAVVSLAIRRVLRATMPDEVHILRDADDATEMDRRTGAVRSVQSAEVTLPADRIDALWTPASLERLARTYWRFLSRATLGVIRVFYTDRERFVCLLVPRLKLLTFDAPEYEMDDRRGVVRWRIVRGVLVARRGRGGDGYLEIDVQRTPAAEPGKVNVRWVYTVTQSRIHVLVTHAFLRSLARLDLAESKVGRLSTVDQVPDPSLPPPRERGGVPSRRSSAGT
jgi:hypothetical protein